MENILLTLFASFFVFTIVVFILQKYQILSAEKKAKEIIDLANQERDKIISSALSEAEDIKNKFLSSAKSEVDNYKNEIEKEIRNIRRDLQYLERKLESKEENLSRKEAYLQKREKELSIRENSLREKENELVSIKENLQKELERISGLSVDEARNILIEGIKKETEIASISLVQKIEEEYQKLATEKARKIIIDSVQKLSIDVINEISVSTVVLPNDEMKGRIIGREGRNIRAFEMITGVDVVIDDTPNVVVLSSFNPIRREIARRTLEKLIEDGRIHPTRIEEIYQKVKDEFEDEAYKIGEATYIQLGLQPMSTEEYKIVGKMKFKISYGQNLLQHSIEVAMIAGSIASELGLDPSNVKKAGLLHDIGKINTDIEGSHAIVGANIARKFGYSDRIVNAIESHHYEVEPLFIDSSILIAADAISAVRPGARKESIESYIKRLENLEKIAYSFENVEKAYAIQAGRELRVFVSSEKVSDDESRTLARNIAKKISEEINFPGQIKVTLIRETRIVETVR